MATSDLRVNLYNKKLMTQEAFDLHFFRFLDNKVNDTTRAAFLQSGVLDDQQIGLTASVANTFTVDLTNADRGVDESGHIMDLGLLPPSYVVDIPFENTMGSFYYVGFKYQSVPSDVERNPRSAEAEYPWMEDTVGDLGNPNSVTDGGTYIELLINGILETGVDHGNRAVRVWLNNPVSPDDAVAYYEGTVLYSGINNVVRIPYTPTAGPLGQTAPEYPISLNALDYTVFVPGVSWFNTKDLRTEPNYVYIGRITGNGAIPTIFNLSDQRPVFLISLDRAYRANSLAEPAPGRTIFADKSSVVIRQSATSQRQQDDSNNALLLDKMGETIAGGFGYSVYHSDESDLDYPFFAGKVVSGGLGSDLEPQEQVSLTLGTNQVVFTRVGVNLLNYLRYIRGGDLLAYLSLDRATGFTKGGLFPILLTGIAAGSCNVTNLDGTIPSFPAGVLTKARFITAINDSIHGSVLAVTHSDFYSKFISITKGNHGLLLAGRDNPVSPEYQRYLSCKTVTNGETNEWGNLYVGRWLMRGGGRTYINQRRTEGDVIGWGQFSVDKRTHNTFDPDYEPWEDQYEWGFDYRGDDFAKSATSDITPFQLAATFRIPYWAYVSGADYVRMEEQFVRVAADTLQINRVGFDSSYIPGSSTTGTNWILCEIQGSSASNADGVYFVQSKPAINQLRIYTIAGTVANFPVGYTGDIRFYGGAFFGPVNTVTGAGAGNNIGYVAQIVCPSIFTGGLRLVHYANDGFGSTDYRNLLVTYNRDGISFGVRDGGQTFARALTTKAPFAGHGLTQWDQVVTSLLHADRVATDPGNNRWITAPDLATEIDIVRPVTLANWAPSRVVNIFRGMSSLNGSQFQWWRAESVGLETYIRSAGAIVNEYGYYVVPFTVPHGATITTIQFYIDPHVGDGTNNSFSFKASRKLWNSAGPNEEMTALGFQNAASAVIHTASYVPTQNNTVNNSTYQYQIHFRSSFTPGVVMNLDYLYGIRIYYTIPALGQSWFDVV